MQSLYFSILGLDIEYPKISNNLIKKRNISSASESGDILLIRQYLKAIFALRSNISIELVVFFRALLSQAAANYPYLNK